MCVIVPISIVACESMTLTVTEIYTIKAMAYADIMWTMGLFRYQSEGHRAKKDTKTPEDE